MMSSRSVETLIDSVLQRKMPLFNGTIAATGLSTPQNMSAFLGKQTLQFSGGYFSYDPSGKDGAGFTPSLLDGRSPVSHHSGMDGQNHIIYRQDSKSEEGHSYSSPQCHTPVKQGFTLYTKSPGVSSPTAATSVIVRKQKSGSESASPLTEKSVYLAIPKPIYGHNPCCNELGCVIGQRYSVEHRSPRISNPVYEHDWRQSEAHYTETLPIQRTAQETLVQQRSLQLEPGTEPLKRIAVETYSPGRARTLPGVVEPSYSSYPCTPPRTLFGSLSEQSQHLQTSPRAYPSLYPSHPTYEHMTSEIYQDRSPISKYGQLTQHPMFYYPQANVEVENRTQCKDISSKHREDVPVILKHAIPNSQDHYVLAQSLRGEISLPLSGTETLPNNSLLQGYDYPCYAVPRLHLNTSHIRAALKRPPAMHSNRLNVSPSIQHIDDPIVSSAIPHKEKSSDSLHAEQSHTSPLFLHLDQTSPTAPLRKSEASPPNVQINRFFPQLRGIHRDRPVLSPTSITVDNSCVTHVPCTKQPKGLPTSPVSPVAWLPHLPNHCSGPVHRAVANNACRQQIIYSPATSKKTLSSSATGYPKGTLKRSISHSSTPIVIKEEEDGDLCEVELSKKRQKVKDEKEVGNNSDSPPMPVINHVFSLAPYKAYLQASGVLLSGRLPQRTEQSSEVCEDPPKPQQKQTKPEKVEQQPDVCLVSKENCPDNKTEKPVVEICELKNIKEEKLDPADTDKPVQSSVSQDCVKVIKEEPDECGLSDCGPMLVIKKCKPDDLENKPSLTNENTTSDEVKPVEVTAQQNTSSQGDECLQNEQVLDPPKPISPPQPPPPRPSPLNFKNIPPQCLKLSTYKIILPDSKLHDSVKIPPKPQPVQPPSEITEKTEVKMPVRKHFLELHHSLSKLISESVSASSEQSLRTWLSQLELPEPASPTTKFQKVTCLLGVKGRETCLNEEIKSSLNKVVERLREYTVQERCPFPHVMRAGAVFLPMLVVKELLFPMVQGSLIDQVLQEHKVELRPTTLSEEKILIQLHKRACSSRLRRLMSLKHLPDIYADVVNLLYYTTVCTHLGLNMDDSVNGEPDEGSEVSSGCTSPGFSGVGALEASSSESHPQRGREANGNGTKSRVKNSSRRMFLDSCLSDEEKQDSVKEIESEDVLNQSSTETQSGHQSEEVANSDGECVVAKQDGYIDDPQSMMLDNSWTRPLTSDDVSSSDTEISDAQPSASAKSPVKSKSCSGMILKLRRMFSGGLNRKRARYQAVSESGAFTDPSLSQAEDEEKEGAREGTGERRTPKVTHRWQRAGGFSPALRPLSGSSKRKHRSLLKIKYCPYLSACHSAEHRRRWVLRSAVKRARRAMRFYYPDLVGKRIHHLYEENDKSEVWYRGEVLRIHEAHSNPLKTIFEVRYDSEPEWKYYLELLIDYKKGWLKIED